MTHIWLLKNIRCEYHNLCVCDTFLALLYVVNITTYAFVDKSESYQSFVVENISLSTAVDMNNTF